MSLATLAPIGPHVTGVIRFASVGEGDDFRQMDEFEVLSRVHEIPVSPEQAPKLRPHPISQSLRSELEGANAKLQQIPVTLMFDKVENNLRARYEAFDLNLNRLACVGDGENCSRANFGDGSVVSAACAGPDSCAFANSAGLQCQLRVRLSLQIDGQDDKLSVFELQSGGIHTYRTLQAKLQMLGAVLDGKLRHVPLALTMYAKSSPAFEFKPFYVADLVLREGVGLDKVPNMQAAEAAAETAAKLHFERLESAVESIRANAPLSLVDDDENIISIAPRMPPRVRTNQGTAGNPGGPSGSRSLAEVVKKARDGAGEPENAKSIVEDSGGGGEGGKNPLSTISGIDLVPATSGAAVAAVAAVVPDATMQFGTELPPTPL